ncbi:DNA helicase [Rubrivivax gelatinosus]|nr:DNA helicase [Rubrivivax gelatinosus]
MKQANDAPLRILRFWRDLEIFNIPTAPASRDANEQTQVATLRRRDALPWRKAELAPTQQFGYVHVVYLGVADTEDLSRLLLRSLFPDSDLSERERQRVASKGWLAAFVVDESGRAKADSYLPASFVHGVAALRETNELEHINARLERAKEEFAQRRQSLPEDPQTTLDWDVLDEELRIVRSLLGDAAQATTLDWRVVVRTSRVKRRYLDDSLQAATEYLNSFYLDDLDRLIALAEKQQPFGRALRTYLGPELPQEQRADILNDDGAMAALVSAARLPSARWPASPRQALVLAQQAAVSQLIHALGAADGLIGVNGPPGTGKTTLLCDVIAEVVTERARRLAALNRPGDLFEDKTSVAGKSFFPLKAQVVGGTSIVVASTNNNAVKNITQELPARRKIADEFAAADYFAEVMREIFRAQKVVGQDREPVEPWGVIAAALGNAGNRRSFAQAFFRDEFRPQRQAGIQEPAEDAPDADLAPVDADKPPSIKQLLEAASGDYRRYQNEWSQARQDFLALQQEFERCREVLVRAEQAARHLDEGRHRLDELVARERTLGEDIELRERALPALRDTLSDQRAVVDGARAVLEQARARSSPTLWDRLMKLLGHETGRMAALRVSMEAPTQALADATAALSQTSRAFALAEAQLARQREQHKAAACERAALERERQTHERALQAGHATGARHFPDAGFWALPADARHRASIAVGPALDELRARLFLQAMALHRLTVLANAGKFIANLRAVNGMLTGGSRDRLASEHRPLLWDAFFFVVPVVSTTLASFDRLFAGMGQDSLGWLLLDEAGQATPQSAAGAIWRSRRAVIVGDPLQIEPVFTVPLSLAEDLRRRQGVAASWSPIDESVQTLADRVTPFGSWVRRSGDGSRDGPAQRLWTGMPLRTHRRCDDPMFSLANRIAYAGQMVQGRVDTAGRPTPWTFDCCLGDSAWFDLRSDRSAHPVVPDEIDFLLECVAKVLRDNGGKTRVYVISPFRKVAQACSRRIGAAGFGGIECGTVHTFQGKEAQVVFLVLGTAPGQAGSGARSWAASRPNLLNVALTRAQCRLYVIGNASQWGALDYFRELRDALPALPVPAR